MTRISPASTCNSGFSLIETVVAFVIAVLVCGAVASSTISLLSQARAARWCEDAPLVLRSCASLDRWGVSEEDLAAAAAAGGWQFRREDVAFPADEGQPPILARRLLLSHADRPARTLVCSVTAPGDAPRADD